MKVKEITTNRNKNYLIGIKETEHHVMAYILQKRLIGYKKLHNYKTLKTLIPDYDYITLCAICDYERKLENKNKLVQWSLN